MANVDDILNSMLEEMKKYKKEYDEATTQINTIVTEYSTQIDNLQKQRLALQEEGNKKIDLLNARREQLSGKHSSLYEQYKKFAGKEPDFTETTETPKSEKVEEKKVDTKKTVTKTTTTKSAATKKETKADDKKEKSLSPDEIAKLAEITGANTATPTTDNKGNEIPEYLQEEYNK